MTEIIFENTTIGYNPSRPLVIDVNLKLGPGIHLLLGPNGAGKTALLKTIAGLIKPLAGRVIVDGFEPYKESRRRVARVIGITWQEPYYGFVEATVRDEINLILKQLKIQGNTTILGKLVPPELMDRDPFSLSGGEAKRVSLASVLIADQPVWLLDEPFDNLDLNGVRAVVDLVKEAKKTGKTLLLAVHNPFYIEVASSDTILLIDPGRRAIDVYPPGEVDDSILEKHGVLPRSLVCR
jgi:energy-coupling factor transport system ATP-binding protein